MSLVEFRAALPSDDVARVLIDAADAALTQLYGPSTTPLQREQFTPPEGGYLVGWLDGVAVAGGGFTRHDESSAEIRRMFVVPEARSRGVGRELLDAVERAARSAGYRRAILDTGPKQPHAEALYRSAGYLDIPNYRGATSRGSYWGAKTLV